MKSEFEKYAQNKISGHFSGVDKEELWKNIEPHVQSKKRKRRFIIIFLWGLFACAIVFSAIYFWKNETNARAETISDAHQNIWLENNLSNQTISIQNMDSLFSNKESKIIDEGDEGLKFDHGIKNYDPIKKTLVKDEKKLVDKLGTKLKQPNSTVDISLLKKEKGIERHAEIDELDRFTEKLSILPIKPFSLIQNIDLKLNKLTTESDTIVKSPLGIKTKYWIGIHLGGSYPFVNMDATPSRNSGYLLARKKTEKQLETIHLGLDASVAFKNNFYIKSGIEYTRIASQFDYKKVLIESDSFPNSLLAIYINSMDTTHEFGTLILDRKEMLNKKTFNYFHTVDIPFLVGYDFGWRNWLLGVEGGCALNLFTKRKGEIFDDYGRFYDLDADAENYFKDNLGLRFTAGLRASYTLSQNFRFSSSVIYWFPTTLSSKNNPLKQKYSSVGVNVGVNYCF